MALERERWKNGRIERIRGFKRFQGHICGKKNVTKVPFEVFK